MKFENIDTVVEGGKEGEASNRSIVVFKKEKKRKRKSNRSIVETGCVVCNNIVE